MRILFTFVVLIHFTSMGQKINQIDENGNKHGSWSAYVDSSLCEVDSSIADFHTFSTYVHGKNTFQYECSKWKRKLKVDHSNSSAANKLLSGTVDYYNDKGSLVESHTYNAGRPTYYKLVNYSADETYYWTEVYYFDSLYNGIEGTYYYVSENNEGVHVSEGWFRNGPQGWKVYESEDFDNVYFVAGDSTLGVFEASKGDYKYPYFGYNVPPYLAGVVGYDGIGYGTFELGLAGNVSDTYLARKTGSMIGGSILFRYNQPINPDSVGVNYLDTNGNLGTHYWTPDTSFWGMAFEIGNYSLISYGIGYNFHTDGTHVTHGVRPFIGTTLFNLQILYAYNIFNRDKNRIGRLINGRFIIRYAIPIPRKKYRKEKT